MIDYFSRLFADYKLSVCLLCKMILCIGLVNGSVEGATTVVFTAPSQNLTSAIFPSDLFTKAGPTGTGLQVQLPADENDCRERGKAVCGYSSILSGLDGFSVNPRISVCFSGPVDTSTLGNGISFVPVGKPAAVPIGINQTIVDPVNNCMYAKPERVLEQQTRYLLLVRNSVKDSNNGAIAADPRFRACLVSGQPYCQSLNSALNGVAGRDSVVAGSVFTTLSATAWLEGAYKYVDRTQPGLVLPAGFPWIFSTSQLRSITWNPENSALGPQDIPIKTALADVGKVAFGLYLSPNFVNTTGEALGAITTSPDRPVAVPQFLGGLTFGYIPVSFHVFLPKTPAPSGGYPVVIYGHGLGDSQFGAPTYMASTLARSGYATVAIEISGHGYGPGSTVALKDRFGFTYKMLTPGRGVQLAPGQPIGQSDGCIAPGPIAVRDCGRQTAVDLFALIKTIQRTNGLNLGLNPRAISYVGQSFGSIYGTLMQAVAPEVKMSILNAGGGPFVDIARLAVNGRPLGVQYLCALGLLNVDASPGNPSACSNPDGFNSVHAQPQDYFHDEFNDNYVYRDRPVVTDPQPGSLEIQAAFEAAEWLGMLGDVLSYAPHLKDAPLPGVPAKASLMQVSDGDLEVPNPTNTAFVRAAGAQNSSIRFRFLEALNPPPVYPALQGVMDPAIPYPFPILPHRILSNPTILSTSFPDVLETPLALAEQLTAVEYFNNGGSAVPDSNVYLNLQPNPYFGRDLFEKSANLPPGLNFVQIPK